MPVTACTSYYTTTITGYNPASGDTVGSIVTFYAPKPVWGDKSNATSLQCNAVTLGASGLNN